MVGTNKDDLSLSPRTLLSQSLLAVSVYSCRAHFNIMRLGSVAYYLSRADFDIMKLRYARRQRCF